VAFGSKPDFPPLLKEGFHQMTLAALRKLCVANFSLSATRDTIMTELEAVCHSMSLALMKAEVWVDCSFVSQKIDPMDVDLVVVIQHGVNSTSQQQDLLTRVANKTIAPVICDGYVHVEYPNQRLLIESD
jgi:hypothetical protein